MRVLFVDGCVLRVVCVCASGARVCWLLLVVDWLLLADCCVWIVDC